MENEQYRQQKAAEQPEEPAEPAFLAFSEADAAAARAAAAKEAALQKTQVSVRDQALSAIEGIRQQVDGLEQQVLHLTHASACICRILQLSTVGVPT